MNWGGGGGRISLGGNLGPGGPPGRDRATLATSEADFGKAFDARVYRRLATFVSPFVGRLDDIGEDGMGLIADIVQIYSNYPSFRTQVLVASVRHPMHIVEAAKIGADVCTVPPSVLRQLAKHPLTDRGLDTFLADWKKTGQTIPKSDPKKSGSKPSGGTTPRKTSHRQRGK